MGESLTFVAVETALFALLDACVTGDGGPSGIRGTIGVGVLGDGLSWWIGQFDTEVKFEREDRMPEACDAAVILGRTEAAALLNGQPLSSTPTLQIFGNRKLLLRFLGRFINRQDATGIRVPQRRRKML